MGNVCVLARFKNMKLIFLGSGGGRFRDHNPEEDDRRI